MKPVAPSSFEDLVRSPALDLPVMRDHTADAIRAQSEATSAKTMRSAIVAQLQEFQSKLKPDEEIGAMLASFGQQITISVTGVAYRSPHLMIFTGTGPDGREFELIQHTSLVNLLLVKIKVTDRKPHRVGFELSPT